MAGQAGRVPWRLVDAFLLTQVLSLLLTIMGETVRTGTDLEIGRSVRGSKHEQAAQNL